MIKGLRPKLAEAGKIKIGGLGPEKKSKTGKAYRIPQKLDHFLVTGTERNADGDLAPNEEIMSALERDDDGQIREIPIVLHSDEIDEVFLTSYAMYSGRRCACRGDGEKATRREIKNDQYTGAEKKIACPCPYLRASAGPICKPNGKLFCSITVPGASVAGAVHIWRTTSIISIEQMIGSLLQIKSICGTLRGVPLWLRVKPITVEPPGSGPITVYCCHVELRSADIAEIQRMAIQAAEQRRRLGWDDRAYRGILTLPAHGETEDEQREIADEFYPEDASNAPVNVTGKGTSAADITARLVPSPQPDEPAPRAPAAVQPGDVL